LPMLILADVGNVTEARDRLVHWLEDGGVLVRFAGPHLAAGDDDLVPVKLRRGGGPLPRRPAWGAPPHRHTLPPPGPLFRLAAPPPRRAAPLLRQGGRGPRPGGPARRGRPPRPPGRRARGRPPRRARGWSPPTAAEGGCLCFFFFPPIRAGQTCRYRAHSSRC